MILKNIRHELFAQALFKGMSQTDAAIVAGYMPSRATKTGAELVTYSDIIERKEELGKMTESNTVMPVKERKERLSELSRARLVDFVDADGNITLEAPNNGALQEVVIQDWRGGKDKRAKSRTSKVKLHNPITAIAELNKMEGEYPPAKVELEPGKELKEALAGLLSRLRGYDKKE